MYGISRSFGELLRKLNGCKMCCAEDVSCEGVNTLLDNRWRGNEKIILPLCQEKKG